jgi:hypothetical protein
MRWVTAALLALAALLLLAPAAPAQSPAGPRAAAPILPATMSATQMAKLTASDGANGDLFGWAVAVSGDVIAVGAGNRTVGEQDGAGAVYIYTRSGGSWAQTQEIFPDASAGDGEVAFGFSVALQGDTLVVGAPAAAKIDDSASGAAYVYKNVVGVWSLSQTLLPAERGKGWILGTSVTLDGDQLLIGAAGAYDDPGPSGAGYVYTRSAGVWSESAELRPAAADRAERAGWSTAISGDTALLGSLDANRAWVFTKSGSTWSNTQAIDGPAGSAFGWSMALAGDMACIGARTQTVNGNEAQGAVHVLTRSGGVWTEAQQITLADGAAGDGFGWSVARSGDALVATILGHPVTPDSERPDATEPIGGRSGKGFVYVLKNGAWERQAATLSADDLQTSSEFGWAAALDGGVAVIGAPVQPDATVPGPEAAYAYAITDTVTPSVSGGHGTVSPATAQAVPLGGTPTFTFTPGAKYAVDEVLLDGTAVDMTGDNAYTFAPVYADHALTVSFYNAAGPKTTIAGAPRGWSRKAVKLKFTATRAVDGKPVNSIEYKVDGEKWRYGRSVTVKRQGQTKVRARATDTRGNVGPTVTATVRIAGGAT